MSIFVKHNIDTGHFETELKFVYDDENTISQKLGIQYNRLLSLAFPNVLKSLAVHFESNGYSFPELRWIQQRPTYPSFQHIAFGYQNNLYSVIIAFVKDGEVLSLERDHRNQLRECEANNLIPCLFPVICGSFAPRFPECHLIRTDTGELISIEGGDKMVPMSEWELSNFAVDCVMHDIEKNGGHIASYCDHPLISPNIFFTDKEGKKSYAVVKAISQNTPDNSSFKPSAQMIERMSGTNGYLAEVIYEYSYEKDNSMTPLKEGYESKILYRGYPFEFNYYGLKKIEDIVKERGTISDTVYDIK